MRGFFGFAIAAPFSAELDRAALSLPREPKLQLLAPGDYHVTIKFLSEFSSTEFFRCLGDLCGLGAAPLGGLVAGKLALWPTVLALECEPSPELREWQTRVNELLERKGFLQERHPRFHPHITLARRKEGWRLPEIEAALRVCERGFEGRPVPIGPPLLWRSEPDGTGRRHQPFLSPWFG